MYAAKAPTPSWVNRHHLNSLRHANTLRLLSALFFIVVQCCPDTFWSRYFCNHIHRVGSSLILFLPLLLPAILAKHYIELSRSETLVSYPTDEACVLPGYCRPHSILFSTAACLLKNHLLTGFNIYNNRLLQTHFSNISADASFCGFLPKRISEFKLDYKHTDHHLRQFNS